MRQPYFEHLQVNNMKSPYSLVLLGLCAYAAAMPMAEAHTFGAQGAGPAEGFAHPFLGLDHLLAMIAVGLWAAQLGGRARWFAPAAFVGVMAVSAWLGSSAPALPMLEPAIAGSVLVLGLLVAFAVRLPTRASVGLVGLLAFFHGFAHGMELPDAAAPALYALGFLASTAMLHGIGLALGLSMRGATLLRLGGSMIALTGLYLLANA
jgi:urease accessory protein